MKKHGRLRSAGAVLAVLTVFAAVLRLYNAGSQSIWFDESVTYHFSKHSPLEIIRLLKLKTTTTHPPLYFFFTHIFLALGDSELVLRLPALLCGVAGVPAMYFLVRRISGGASAVFAALMLTVSIFHIAYSQEARSYTAFFLFAAIGTHRVLKLLEGGVGVA